MPGIVSELGMTWSEAGLTVVTAIGIYVTIIVLSRVFGQRHFSASSSYDLAFTFAMGSLVGRVVLVRTSLLNAVVGLLTMFALHAAATGLHHHIAFVHRAIQNRPVLLVADGSVLEEGMRTAQVSEAELHQQLRLSGHGALEQVQAAILERNGQMTVLQTGTPLDDRVLAAVVGSEALLDARDR